MLKITIELIPHGVKEKSKVISELFIDNKGKKNRYDEYTYGYKGWVEHESSKDKRLNEMFGRKEFKGTVQHDRRNMVYILLHKIICQIIEPYT
jgi:hypothetical protein